MDVILFSTAAVRDMFDSLDGRQPAPADPSPMDKLRDALAGELARDTRRPGYRPSSRPRRLPARGTGPPPRR